jgi:hypothetical protein
VLEQDHVPHLLISLFQTGSEFELALAAWPANAQVGQGKLALRSRDAEAALQAYDEAVLLLPSAI